MRDQALMGTKKNEVQCRIGQNSAGQEKDQFVRAKLLFSVSSSSRSPQQPSPGGMLEMKRVTVKEEGTKGVVARENMQMRRRTAPSAL
jgi:hypothetical protein